MSPWWIGELRASPMHPPLISAQSSLNSSYPAGCSQLWLCTLRPLCTRQWPDLHWLLAVLKFEIWLWWCPLSTMVKNRFYLILCDVINHDVISAAESRVRKKYTFHWCIDCEKYRCPICRGRKLLGWPLYGRVFCIELYFFYIDLRVALSLLIYQIVVNTLCSFVTYGFWEVQCL